MLALSIIAHPSPDSFSHAMAAAAETVLRGRDYSIRSHDLYAERFNPIQPVVEALNTSSEDALVEQHCADLQRADLILVFHPNWWSQPPAILKGWIDRVFRLNTAYAYPEGTGVDGVPIGLLRAKAALVFNTSNTHEARELEVFGDPLDGLWKRSVFQLCGINTVTRRMFGPMASSTPDQRDAWLSEVRALVGHHA
jgi:putative NADPH-quinone reductase